MTENPSISLGEPGAGDRRAAALDARAACLCVERQVTNGRLGLRLDRGFALLGSAPGREHETGPALHQRLELVVRVGGDRVLLAVAQRAVQERLLDAVEQLANPALEAV